MKHGRILSIAIATLAATGFARSAAAAAAPSCAINDVEGRATLDGQPMAAEASETVALEPGHTLETGQGRAELLLTPGVFLRLAENSAVRLISVSAASARAELLRGEALVEVIQVTKPAGVEIVDKEAYTRLRDDGIYLFKTDGPAVEVYDGKAQVEDDRRRVALGTGRELVLTGKGPLKAEKFDRDATDSLYAWSQQRAEYVAQASESSVYGLLALDSQPKYETGWYWNPWFKSWSLVPGKGYFRSPFGYGYYSPWAPHVLSPAFADFRE